MVKKYGQLYLEARKTLMATEDSQTASFLARHLLCHVSGKTQEQFLADREMYASERIEKDLLDVLDRTLHGEPLAYILGEWSFYGLDLIVNKNVLIPRDDTCAVAGLAMKKGLFSTQNPRILDLCTGSGCIGLAVASRVKNAHVTLADISEEALAVAKENVKRLNLSARVCCVRADALQPAENFLGKFDMIISNPPYITTEDMLTLEPSVKDFEPHLALHGGEDGLLFYRAIVQNYKSALKPGGYLCFEYGMEQGDDVCGILKNNGYTVLERVRDDNDRERAVLACYGRKEA